MEYLSWPQVAERRATSVVVVPVGAVAKGHGPHLPMKTEWLLAREISRRIAEELSVLIAPVIAFGYYPAFRHWPGSQHLSLETFPALVKDLISGLIAQRCAPHRHRQHRRLDRAGPACRHTLTL